MNDIYMLRELKQVKAVADPLRIRILNLLCEKSMTTKQAAEALGENVNKLYHHVDTLEEAGLIRLTHTKQNRGTLEKYFEAVAKHFTLSPVLFEVRLDTNETSTDISELTFSSALQATLSEIKESINKKLIKATSSNHFFRRLHIKTDKASAEKLNQKLQSWLDECEAASRESGDVTYGITATLYPISEKALKEKKSSKK
jgi:DNA-binding transcriptional ArsR family regulator